VALPDVLTSLSTGLIEVSYAPALAIIALQWQSKVSYVVEQPFGYHFQGFLLSQKAWKKIKPEDQKIVEQISDTYAQKISETNLTQANDAFAAIQKQGVKAIKWPESDVNALLKARDDIYKSLTGSLLSKDVVGQLEKALK
jgi:TRAP-type C4-dicarboxylate transport system substrate-binding protein